MKWIITLVVVASCSGKTAKEADRLDKFEQFCIATRDAVRTDRLAFEGDDPLKREAAYERFYESRIIYHNVDSMLMCVDEVPKLSTGCYLNKSWGCLANLAREIEALFPSPRKPPP